MRKFCMRNFWAIICPRQIVLLQKNHTDGAQDVFIHFEFKNNHPSLISNEQIREKLVCLFLRLVESSIVKFVRKFRAMLGMSRLSLDNIPWGSAYQLFFWRLHISQRRHTRPRAYVFILMRYPVGLNLLSCGAPRIRARNREFLDGTSHESL